MCCVSHLCVVCAGAAAKAESLEGSVASTKDQLLRLTADFENFRKRTVSSRQGTDTTAGFNHPDIDICSSCSKLTLVCMSAAVHCFHVGHVW